MCSPPLLSHFETMRHDAHAVSDMIFDVKLRPFCHEYHWVATRRHPRCAKSVGVGPYLAFAALWYWCSTWVVSCSRSSISSSHGLLIAINLRSEADVLILINFLSVSSFMFVQYVSKYAMSCHVLLDALTYFYRYKWYKSDSESNANKYNKCKCFDGFVCCSGLPWRKALILANTMALPRRCPGPWQETISSVDALICIGCIGTFLIDAVYISYTSCIFLSFTHQVLGVEKDSSTSIRFML